jgi:flagellar motor switch protein FliM
VAETFAQSTGRYLGGLLRTPCRLEFESLLPTRFAAGLGDVLHPGCVGLVTWSGQGGSGWIHLDPGLASAVLDRALGGPREEPGPRREFTPLELRLARRITEKLVDRLAVAASSFVPWRPRLESLESDPERLPVVDEAAPVVVLRYHVSLDPVLGTLSVAVPEAAWEDPTPAGREESDPGGEDAARIQDRVQRAVVDVAARLETTRLTLDDLARLTPQSLLHLDPRATASLDVEVQGRRLWRGHLEQRGGMRVVRVTDEVEARR